MDMMLSFYEDDVGLTVVGRDAGYTALGIGPATESIVILHHDEKSLTPTPNAAGLYHYALLVPDRRSLAASYLSLGKKGVVFDGYADHQVSEALYLRDPDSNGIEIYSDRPKSEWKFDEGGAEMTAEPLDLDSLIKDLPHNDNAPLKALAEGSKVGHVHLKVSDLQTSMAFYRDGLGFELMRYWGSAAFLSAGRYHHHVGMNTWESLGGLPARKTWIGLEYCEFKIPDTNLVDLSSRLGDTAERVDSGQLFVSDPDDIALVFRAS
jgi:catechol 2,3-dioxygenase